MPVVDPPVVLAAQPWQRLDPAGAQVEVHGFGMDAGGQGAANQPRRHRVEIAQDPDGRKAADGDLLLVGRIEPGGGQRPQVLTLGHKAHLAGQIALADEVLEEAGIGGAIGEVAAALQAQGLVNGLLEAVVGLLDIAILVGHAGLVGGRLEAVMGHERGIALGPLAVTVGNLDHGGTQIVGAVLLRDAAELPEAGLHAFGQGLKAFREADLDGFHVGVGEHQMVDQMREKYPRERDLEVTHGGKVGLGKPAWLVALLKDHGLGRSVLGAPGGDMALEGAELAGLVAPGVAQAELGKQGFDLERGVTLELLLHPGPIVHEGVGAGAVDAGLLQLAGKGSGLLIFASGALTHPGAGGGVDLGFAFSAFTAHEKYLVIGFHGAHLGRECGP